MIKRVNIKITNLRRVLSIGLAAATLAVVLTYVLGAEAILQTPYAEPAHELYMSIMPEAITGGMGGPGMHGGPASEEQMRMQDRGRLANNILGSPAGMAAAGFANVVVQGTIVFAAAAFVISWKQRSFVVAGLLAAGGVILMILPLANMNFMIPGPIIGVVVGLGILGLGVVKGIRTARTAVTIK